MSIKGWKKRGEYQWRHDGFGINNKLNIFTADEDGDRDTHVSRHTGQSRNGYVVVYSDNDRLVGDVAKHYNLSRHSTLKEARSFATSWMRDNSATVEIQ